MTPKGETSQMLDKAFRAAFLLTGSAERAENAVLEGIAALGSGDNIEEILTVATLKSAIRQRPDFPSQPEQVLSDFPQELQRLTLLGPIARDCFILRVLLGMAPGTSPAILDLTIPEIEDRLMDALQELPVLGARNPNTSSYQIPDRSPTAFTKRGQ